MSSPSIGDVESSVGGAPEEENGVVAENSAEDVTTTSTSSSSLSSSVLVQMAADADAVGAHVGHLLASSEMTPLLQQDEPALVVATDELHANDSDDDDDDDDDDASGEGAEAGEAGEAGEEEVSNTTTVFTRFRRALSGAIKTVASKSVKTLMGAETEALFQQVLGSADDYFADVEHGTFRSAAGMRVMAGLKVNNPKRTYLPLKQFALVRNGFYWFQFAEAAFGRSLLHGLKAFENGISFKSNEEVVCNYLKLEVDALLCAFWGSENHRPGHFLCVDHRTRSIVVSVRGTYSFKDILADLNTEQTPFLDGFAHSGMALSTELLYSQLIPRILELRDRHESYALVTTGHSLGASVALMFALRVQHDYPDFEVSSWCFGCPPCVSWNLAQRSSLFAVSFVNGVDIVPRLSMDNMIDLKKRVKAILSHESTSIWGVVSGRTRVCEEVEQHFLEEKLIIPNGEEHEWCDSLTTHHKDKLWATPCIIDLYFNHNGDSAQKVARVAELSSLDRYDHIVVANTMFRDHLPNQYDRAFRDLLISKERQDAAVAAAAAAQETKDSTEKEKIEGETE